MKIRNVEIVALLMLLAWQPFAHGLDASSTIKGASAPAPAPTIDGPNQAVALEKLGEIKAHLSTIESGISTLDAKIGDKDHTPSYLALISSGFGFIGLIIGACITWFTQRKLLTHQQTLADSATKQTTELANAKAAHELQLAENRANIEVSNSFVQWQLKQLSELYGPLRALLQQSNVMYRHMNTVLIKTEPDRFRLRDGFGEDFDHKLFEIQINGKWIPFRTILHIDEVYGKNYHVDDYFDAVVAIGAGIVKVIEENAGYARPEQSDEVLSVFGKYLAHYSVLERLHSQTKEKHYPSEVPASSRARSVVSSKQTIAVDESAVFPKEIQGLVDAGFKEIIAELNAWRAKAAA